MQVLCCCNPSNEIGSVPDAVGHAAGLPLREWIDRQGDTGMAFSSHGRPESEIAGLPGFKRGGPKGGTRKTWRKR